MRSVTLKRLGCGCAAAALLLGSAAGASAAQTITPTSYDAPNGSGINQGGGYNYFDQSYSGSGDKTVDGAALTGGLGDLADGVSTTQSFVNFLSEEGDGPYVGWNTSAIANPTVTFHFKNDPTITAVTAYVDNYGQFGVSAPGSIVIDGTSYSVTPPAVGTAGPVTFSGLNLTGASHTVQFTSNGGWIFVNEVSFTGAGGGVPEPASWALMLLGFGGLGAALRARRRSVALA